MSDQMNISLNIAVGGCCIDSAHTDAFEKQVGVILHEMVDYTKKFNSADYGYSGSDLKVNLFSSPFLADAFWMDFAQRNNLPMNVITPHVEVNDQQKLLLGKANSVTNINVSRNWSAGSGSVLPDWIADQSDIALLLWDGLEDFNNRETWALIQSCRRNNVPCIWVDVHSPEHIYWSMDSYYDTFSREKLQDYIITLFSKNKGAFDPPGKSRIPFWGLWNFLYNRFMKKYKAMIQPMPYIVDKILDKTPESCAGDLAGDSNLQKVVNRFHSYDSNAIGYSQKYRTSIYMRSIIPFMAAVFIAFGSFAETVLGFIYKVPASGMSPWAILASVGFLINGLVFYYIYRLAGNSTLSSWHPRFIDNRFVAEVLRLTAHFAPFGIPINFTSSLNRFGSKISQNPHVSNELRRITRSLEVPNITFNANISNKLLKDLTNMVNDQIIYHEYSIARYTAIITKLRKFTAVLFTIGLTVVVSRGCLQFVLFYVDIGYDRNGILLETFLKSLINMFALIIPAWASYFSLKLSLSNFEGLMNNSVKMKNYLTIMKNILNDEMKRVDISFERIYLFSRELTKLMLGEVADWYSQISTQRFTRL